MLEMERCNSENEQFIDLVKKLNEDLQERNGVKQDFYDKYNILPYIDTVLILKKDGKAVACGCFKPYDNTTVEIKRMFVKKEYRGNGYSKQILRSLEKWASELGFKRAVLETGKNQLEALALYKKSNYTRIENYGPYTGVEHSVCFGKNIQKKRYL